MMWFSTAVLTSQIVVLYGLAAPAALRGMYRAWLARNPEWLRAHPEFAASHGPRRAVVLSLLLGAGWLALLSYDLLGDAARGQDPTGGRDWRIALLIASMLAWVALEWLVAAVEVRRIVARIPPPARRRASLAPRTLAAYARPWSVVPGLLLLLVLAALYLRAWSGDSLAAPVLAWRLICLVGGAALWGLVLRHSVHRRREAGNELPDDWVRRAEVRGCIACLYLFVLAAGWRALQDLSGIYVPGELDFFSWASLLLQAVLLGWLIRSRKTDKEDLPS